MQLTAEQQTVVSDAVTSAISDSYASMYSFVQTQSGERTALDASHAAEAAGMAKRHEQEQTALVEGHKADLTTHATTVATDVGVAITNALASV